MHMRHVGFQGGTLHWAEHGKIGQKRMFQAHRHVNSKSELWCCGKSILRRQSVHQTDDITPDTYC